jgi:hypothetical protein
MFQRSAEKPSAGRRWSTAAAVAREVAVVPRKAAALVLRGARSTVRQQTVEILLKEFAL